MDELNLKVIPRYAVPTDLHHIAEELFRTGYRPIEMRNLEGWGPNAKALLFGIAGGGTMELIGDCPDDLPGATTGRSSSRWWTVQNATIPSLYVNRSKVIVSVETLRFEFPAFAYCVECLQQMAAFKLNVYRYPGQGLENDFVLAEVLFMDAPLFTFGDAYDLEHEPHHSNVWQTNPK